MCFSIIHIKVRFLFCYLACVAPLLLPGKAVVFFGFPVFALLKTRPFNIWMQRKTILRVFSTTQDCNFARRLEKYCFRVVIVWNCRALIKTYLVPTMFLINALINVFPLTSVISFPWKFNINKYIFIYICSIKMKLDNFKSTTQTLFLSAAGKSERPPRRINVFFSLEHSDLLKLFFLLIFRTLTRRRVTRNREGVYFYPRKRPTSHEITLVRIFIGPSPAC